jgi:outer membrane protein assembly factor BamA
VKKIGIPKYLFGLLGLLLLFFNSCNYTKHLTQNQTLLVQNQVNIHTDKPIKFKGELQSAALSLITQQPNTHLFDVDALPKYKLWKYNNNYQQFIKDSLNKKILKRKVEKPVLLDTNAIEISRQRIRQYMVNQGYFYADVQAKMVKGKKDRSTKVVYDIYCGKTYQIGKIQVQCPDRNLKFFVESGLSNSFIQNGELFTYFKCGFERERIYRNIRNVGFFDFKSDNVSFMIDTSNKKELLQLLDDPFSESRILGQDSINNKEFVDVTIEIKPTRDSNYAKIYTIKKVVIEIIDLNENKFQSQNRQMIETELDDFTFRYHTLPVNRKVISRNIFFKKGDVYNPKNIEATINRLNQLGLFQFVNITFEKDTEIPGKLIAKISLNTAAKMDSEIRGDISTSDGDYFLGLGGSLTYRNKNLFFGANQLSVRTAFSTEFRNDSLLSGTKEFYRSGNNFSITANLTLPKFIIPFSGQKLNKKNRPFTIIGFNYTLINRLQAYTINNISGSFGYSWKETDLKNWRVNPAFLTVTRVPDHLLSPAFREKLATNDYLRNIFSNNIIYGENIAYEFKSRIKNTWGDFKTLKLGLEEAGTLLKGVNYLYRQVSNGEISPIANYVRFEGDFRTYTNRKKYLWANRMMIGVGVPLGDNGSLPYIKQYSAGGSFSNRGWRARTLGPGRSISNTFKTGTTIIDRTGDLKFELNSELRFNLLKLFSGAINIKGAAFADAGNIWLFYKDKDIPGGELNTNYLYQDIALSSGLGLRLDFSFFVFRLDLGYPIKQPQIPENNGWSFDQLHWRKSGVWNIAIGYPF